MAKPGPLLEGMADNEQTASLHEQVLEEPMKFIGFKLERTTPQCVEGRFVVSKKSCQMIAAFSDSSVLDSREKPFGVLHGGVSALIAESLASTAAHIASGFQRVAGVELSINHLRAAPIGTEVFASAKPVHIGKRLHVWDVTFSKVADSTQSGSEKNPDGGTKLAVSRVTLMAGLTGQASDYDRQLKVFARL